MLRSSHHSAFTLIELLVVIAIIAIIAVVVILVLNPAQLLAQSRDSNRVSDLATMTEALGVFQADQSNGSIGSSNVIYVSIPDPAATSSLGDQCQGLGLIAPPATYTYHCVATSTYRSVDSTGWVPVNFTQASFGSPLGQLPIDPVNQSSSRLYYTYTTNGSQFEFTAPMESQKYQLGGSNDVISNDGGILATVYEKGTKLGLEPLDYGDSSLLRYWPLNEGVGSTSYDYSGDNATGSWMGTATGTSGYYSAGKGGGYQWAGAFDGSSDYVNFGSENIIENLSGITFSVWINTSATGTTYLLNTWFGGIVFGLTGTPGVQFAMTPQGGSYTSASTSSYPSLNSWTYIVGTYNGTKASLYENGILVGTGNSTNGLTPVSALNMILGKRADASSNYFPGLIDDVRIYNRALSAAQIAAMYAAGK
jgi:prepilin-type N-terminal cleavage/methylation domain-containing protein